MDDVGLKKKKVAEITAYAENNAYIRFFGYAEYGADYAAEYEK